MRPTACALPILALLLILPAGDALAQRGGLVLDGGATLEGEKIVGDGVPVEETKGPSWNPYEFDVSRLDYRSPTVLIVNGHSVRGVMYTLMREMGLKENALTLESAQMIYARDLRIPREAIQDAIDWILNDTDDYDGLDIILLMADREGIAPLADPSLYRVVDEKERARIRFHPGLASVASFREAMMHAPLLVHVYAHGFYRHLTGDHYIDLTDLPSTEIVDYDGIRVSIDPADYILRPGAVPAFGGPRFVQLHSCLQGKRVARAGWYKAFGAPQHLVTWNYSTSNGNVLDCQTAWSWKSNGCKMDHEITTHRDDGTPHTESCICEGDRAPSGK